MTEQFGKEHHQFFQGILGDYLGDNALKPLMKMELLCEVSRRDQNQITNIILSQIARDPKQVLSKTLRKNIQEFPVGILIAAAKNPKVPSVGLEGLSQLRKTFRWIAQKQASAIWALSWIGHPNSQPQGTSSPILEILGFQEVSSCQPWREICHLKPGYCPSQIEWDSKNPCQCQAKIYQLKLR